MTEQIDGLPEVVEYGGFKVEYAGTATFKAGGQLWYRHEYAYCDQPHITERVCFFRIEGDNEPIPLVTDGFEVVFQTTRDTRRRYRFVDGQHVATIEPKAKPVPDARRKPRDERRQVSPDLSKRIRSQVKPFGGE